MTKEKASDYRKKKRGEAVDQVMEQDEEELETHFVENPFIKIRERAQ